MPNPGYRDGDEISLRTVRNIIIGVVVLLAAVVGVFKGWENLDAKEIMVVQAPWSGNLTWYTTAGVKGQWFGTVTKYHKRSQFWFAVKSDQGDTSDQSIRVRFNDKGHANISGSLAWEMPIDNAHLTALHTKYGSQDAIEHQLIRTVVEKAVYMTGPLMSSQESAAERRADLLQYIEDQVANGIYHTETVQERQPDPITGELRTVSVVRLVTRNGQVVRSDESPLKSFGIVTFNPSINEIKYDEVVEKQIAEQQKATMSVQTSMANAKKAEQDAITAAKNGEAKAAEAKWAQEVIKATEVTAAEQRLKVADLERQAAEQTKQKNILDGQGEAEKRRLVMQADGALEKKLGTYERVNQMYANALASIKVPIVPAVQTGGNSGGGNNPAMDLMQLLQIKTARDLAVDVTPGRQK